MINPSAAVVGALLAYWAQNHIAINKQVINDSKPFSFQRSGQDVATVDDYLQHIWYVKRGIKHELKGVAFQPAHGFLGLSTPGQDTPTDAPNHTTSIEEWNKQGGFWEDGFSSMQQATAWGGLRAVNHFHNPLDPNGGGYTGFRQFARTGLPGIDLLRNGMSATVWATGGSGAEPNNWGWPAVQSSLDRTSTNLDPAVRQSAMAGFFRAMGQVEHLVEDNTVPDHARNLPHPGQGFEEYMNNNASGLFEHAPTPWPQLDLKYVANNGLRALWDLDVYTGTNPAATSASPPAVGIDEYTQANFLAWNRYALPWWISFVPLIPNFVDFTTVPASEGVSFPGFPYPLLTSANGPYYDSSPSTLPVAPIARQGDKDHPRNWIDDNCWVQYAGPLMQMAHGYPTAVLQLGMQPVRAELVPNPAMPLDVTSFKLRVWNLNADPSLVWNVKGAKILPIRPPNAPGPTQAFITVPLAAPVMISPGTPWESAPFSIILSEQQQLTTGSHTIVSLQATLGNASTPAPITIVAPIPNSVAIFEQQTVTMATGSVVTNNPNSCCAPNGCDACGENALIGQPLVQDSTGTLVELASHVDLFGDVDTDAVAQAQDADARIAGVALVGYPGITQHYNQPTLPVKSTVTVSAPSLDCSAGAFCVRMLSAPDTADPDSMPISIHLDSSDFLGAAGNIPQAAMSNLLLLVWTTSGAIYTHHIVTWRIMSALSAQALVTPTCDLYRDNGPAAYDQSGACIDTASLLSSPPCSPSTFHSWTRSHIFGPLLGLSLAAIQDQPFFSLSPELVIQQLGGMTAPMSPFSCPVPTNTNTSYNITCFSYENSQILIFNLMTGNGECGGFPARPTTPYTAQFTGQWSPEEATRVQQTFGRTDLPMSWTINLQ